MKYEDFVEGNRLVPSDEAKSKKIQRILAALKKRRMTRQEISAVTGIPLESVCGRVHELLDSNRVEVCGSVLCRETGKDREVLRVAKVRRVAV